MVSTIHWMLGCLNCPNNKLVDGGSSEDIVSALQTKNEQLQKHADYYEKQMTKYWLYWKNECRQADADRRGVGCNSQASWSSSPPYRAYGECAFTNSGSLC